MKILIFFFFFFFLAVIAGCGVTKDFCLGKCGKGGGGSEELIDEDE